MATRTCTFNLTFSYKAQLPFNWRLQFGEGAGTDMAWEKLPMAATIAKATKTVTVDVTNSTAGTKVRFCAKDELNTLYTGTYFDLRDLNPGWNDGQTTYGLTVALTDTEGVMQAELFWGTS